MKLLYLSQVRVCDHFKFSHRCDRKAPYTHIKSIVGRDKLLLWYNAFTSENRLGAISQMQFNEVLFTLLILISSYTIQIF